MSCTAPSTSSGESWGTYRSETGRWILWAFFSVFGLIGVAGLIQPSPNDRLTGLIWLVIAGLGAFLGARARVSTGSDGVTTVGWVRTRRFNWNDIERFELVHGQGRLVVRGGRRIMLSGVGGFRFRPREQERLIEALEEDRARARQSR